MLEIKGAPATIPENKLEVEITYEKNELEVEIVYEKLFSTLADACFLSEKHSVLCKPKMVKNPDLKDVMDMMEPLKVNLCLDY